MKVYRNGLASSVFQSQEHPQPLASSSLRSTLSLFRLPVSATLPASAVFRLIRSTPTHLIRAQRAVSAPPFLSRALCNNNKRQDLRASHGLLGANDLRHLFFIGSDPLLFGIDRRACNVWHRFQPARKEAERDSDLAPAGESPVGNPSSDVIL